MALFKFRKGGDESVATPPPPESIDAIRRRARHRLIGATVLVLIGIIAFPVLFDTQPRPIAVDIPIEIPDRNKVKPLAPPAPAAAPAASGKVGAAAPPQAPRDAEQSHAAAVANPSGSVNPPEAKLVKTESKPEAKSEGPQAKSDATTQAKPEVKPQAAVQAGSAPKPDPKAEHQATSSSSRVDDAGKARALPDGRSKTAAPARFVVQVGAFSDSGKARDARRKLERSGLKSYTHLAETKDGKRIRVRVGPFASRSEAEKAASRIKGLDLPAAVLSL